MRLLSERVATWMADGENNRLAPGLDLPAFEPPLLGVAAGDDPLWEFLRQDIGPDFFWTPDMAYKLAFPEREVEASELRVIAWILPQTAATRAAHKREKALPSIEWSYARHYGEMVNEKLRRFVVASLAEHGISSVAPSLLPQWSRALSAKYGFASSWSERHSAYVCGLGTFGLSDGLITAAGKAVRVGSVVARTDAPPTPRPYDTHNAWCLFAAKGKCLACAKRCPAGAISAAGHDKIKCKDYIRNITALHVEREQLGFAVNSCGLCQVGVPCEARNPTARRTAVIARNTKKF